MEQHVVPKFYLRRFADVDKRIRVYSRTAKRIQRRTVANVCAETDFYTMRIEELLSGLESRIAPVIDVLEKSSQLSPRQRADLALFTALQMNRIPWFHGKFDLGVKKTLELIEANPQ